MPTPRLKLPYIVQGQAQKEVTHNDALNALDALVNLFVLDRNLTAPPGSPQDGDAYIVASGGTGAWAAQDGKVAFCLDGGWRFHMPARGLIAYVADEEALIVYTGAAWVGLDTILSLQNVPLFGVNTSADATNRLAVKSDAILFSHDDVTPGTGDLRVTLNKSAAARDAGFVFQDGFSTRALFGLLGDDDFTVKVSPDGSTFHTGFTVNRSTGAVDHTRGAKFSAYCNFGQNYSSGTWHNLAMNAFRHNDQGAAAIASNVCTFTAPTNGYYLFGVAASFEIGGGTPNAIWVGVGVNGLPPNEEGGTSGPFTINSSPTVQSTSLLKLNAGNIVRPYIFFNGAGRIAANSNHFWGARLA